MNERENLRFISAVQNAFQDMKAISNLPDLWASAIPLPEQAGYLLPLCELHAEDKELVETLGRWREDSAHVYPTQFPVTFDGTKTWLRKRLLDAPERILFLIVDPMGRPIGHVGFASALNTEGLLELDNLLRGSLRGHREIVAFAVRALMRWADEVIQPTGYYLRVMSSLKHVIKLDQRLGFVETERIPLRKTVSGDCIAYVDCDPSDTAEPDEYFVRMRYEPASIATERIA